MDEPHVVGLDLSLTGTGIAHPDGRTTTVRTRTADGDRRLCDIRWHVQNAITARVNLVAIEDLPTHAHGAGITGMVHGIVREYLADIERPYVLITAASVKKYATGNGNAPKPDLRMELYKRTGIDIKDDNQVDAWWLRAMALDHLGHPPVDMPKTHRVALDKVVWPGVAT